MAVKLKHWLFKLLMYGQIQITREEWEAEYSNGQWDILRQIDELAHYSVIVGYCHYFKNSGAILDIGCGEGILQERLNPCKHSRYVGVDISAEVIRRASHKQDERTFFVRADASKYSPNEQFDIIVFNECLYYFENPLSIMERYERFLKKGGVFIISMYVTARTKRIWKMLDTVYSAAHEVRVSNKSGHSWTIKVLMCSVGGEIDFLSRGL